MKKNVQHIVIDLEFTPIPKTYKDYRKICRHEIIEIGAVSLDDKGRVKEEFRQFIKPEYSRLDSFCAHLTGINRSQLDSAPSFSDGMKIFSGWVGSRETEFYQWSGTDRAQLLAECNLKGLADNYSLILNAGWYDVQAMLNGELGFNNAFKLETALDLLSITPSGRFHDALDDSVNTAEILKILSNPAEKKKRTEFIKSYYNNTEKAGETHGTTLGELFSGLFTEDDNG